MKKFLLLIAFAAIANVSFAQFGIKAGLNYSNVTSDQDFDDLEGQANFLVGALYQINLSDNFAIRPEAIYIRKGASYDVLGLDADFKSDYFEIPVMAVIGLGSIPLNIQVGPQFSYLLSSQYSLGGTEIEFGDDELENVDYGVALGVGAKINNFILDLRYTRGLKNYDKDSSDGGITIEASSKHFGLQAAVGILF